jgi:hypothetical protein
LLTPLRTLLIFPDTRSPIINYSLLIINSNLYTPQKIDLNQEINTPDRSLKPFPYFQLKREIMALQTGLFKFTGQLNNVIGYRRNGKYFFRSAPEKVRQTAATKRAACSFGIASRKGKLLRHALCAHLDVRYDGTLINRLNKLFIQAGRAHFPDLQGFHFNKHTGLEKLFTLPPVFTANGTLHIPAQELLPQGKATHVELRLIAARIDFAAHRVLSTDVSTAIIELKEDELFNGMALSIPTEGKGAFVVVLQYRSYTICNGTPSFSRDRRYMAANIIHINVPAQKAHAPISSSLRSAAEPGISTPVTVSSRKTGGSTPSLQGPAKTRVSTPVTVSSHKTRVSSPVIARSSQDQRAGRRSNLLRAFSQRE